MGRILPTFWRNKLGSGMMWKTRSCRLKKALYSDRDITVSFVPIVTFSCHQEGGVIQRVAITHV